MQGVSEALARRIRKRGVAVHHRPLQKLRNLLVNPKDKTPQMDQSGVVYQVSCQDCHSKYVGETERPLKTRIKEHSKDTKSPLFAHAQATGHTVDFIDVKTLDREASWFRRGVKEAIHICATGSNLNRDGGRHQLPAVYRPLIHSRDHDEPPGSRE